MRVLPGKTQVGCSDRAHNAVSLPTRILSLPLPVCVCSSYNGVYNTFTAKEICTVDQEAKMPYAEMIMSSVVKSFLSFPASFFCKKSLR